MLGKTGDPQINVSPWSSAAAAQRLRSLLDQRNLSIAALARGLAVTRQTVHRWLQGQHISPGNLQRLSDYFEVDVSWLQSGDPASGPDGTDSQAGPVQFRRPSSTVRDQQRTEFAARSAHMVIWEYHYESDTIRWLGPADDMFGESTLRLPVDALSDRIHADDRDEFLARIHSLSSAAPTVEGLEIRLLAEDQTFQWIEVWAELEQDEQTGDRRLLGSVRDISLGRKLQDELTATRVLLEQLRIRLSMDVFVVATDGRLRLLSPDQPEPGAETITEHPELLRQAVEAALAGNAELVTDGTIHIVATPLEVRNSEWRALVVVLDSARLTAATGAISG